LINQVSDLWGKIGEQVGDGLLGDKRMRTVESYHGSRNQGEAFDGCQKPFEVAVWIFAVSRG
jgi:hypothetical protein